jgi:hypothetical protein
MSKAKARVRGTTTKRATPKAAAKPEPEPGPKPRPRPRPKPKPAPPRPAPGPPSRAARVKTILDDLTSPMVPADAAELFAVSVMDKLLELAPDVMARFNRSWFDVFVDLAIAVINRCDERDVAEALRQVEADEDKHGLLARTLRRRFARSLPAAAVAPLDDAARYWLSRAAIEAAGAAVKDEELWEALWGRKAGWIPVPMLARESPDGPPPTDNGDGADRDAEATTHDEE